MKVTSEISAIYKCFPKQEAKPSKIRKNIFPNQTKKLRKLGRFASIKLFFLILYNTCTFSASTNSQEKGLLYQLDWLRILIQIAKLLTNDLYTRKIYFILQYLDYLIYFILFVTFISQRQK